MALIKLEGNIDYLDMVDGDSTISVKYSKTKKILHDEVGKATILVMSSGNTYELNHEEVEYPSVPGTSFPSDSTLFIYVMELYGAQIQDGVVEVEASISGGPGLISLTEITKAFLGDELTIEAYDTADAVFNRFESSGGVSTENPYKFTVEENEAVIAYFDRIGFGNYYQWIMLGKSTDIVALDGGGYGYLNNGTGDIDSPILNTQVLTLDGASYVSHPQFTFNVGLSITLNINTNTVVSSNYLLGKLGSPNYGVFYTGSAFGMKINGVVTPQLSYSKTDALIDLKITRNTSTSYEFHVNNISIGTIITITTDPLLINVIGFRGDMAYFTGLISRVNYESHLLYYFQDAQGVIIKDQSGNGNDGTLIGANQAIAWGTKSNVAYPALPALGYSKYLVNEIAGTTAHLASPDGSNLGVEELVNGNFDSNLDNWLFNEGGESWSNNYGGSLVIESKSTGNRIVQNTGAIGVNRFITIHIKECTSDTRIDTYLNGSYKVFTNFGETGKISGFITPFGSNYYIRTYGLGKVTISNISIKEVTAIPAYGEWEFKIPYTGNNTIPLISDRIGTINSIIGYEIQLVGYIRLIKDNLGTRSDLFHSANVFLTLGEVYDIKVQRNETIDQFHVGGIGSFAVYIKGGSFGNTYSLIAIEGVGSTGSNPVLDNTYTDTKFLIVDNRANDQISHISKDGQKYDVANFVNGIGTYKVRNSIGVTTLLDADGNELEFAPNAGFSNTGNTLDWVNGDAGLIALATAYGIPNPITYAQMLEIDFSLIPEADLRVTLKDGIFTEWAAQS